jgi:sugar (pentulose or hexulose) kinase
MDNIAIFDIGKTNKKCFVFDEDYRIVFEKNEQLPETTDEDGDPCEDVNLLIQWILENWRKLLNDERLPISAVNFTTYGASFVYVSRNGVSVPEYHSGIQLPLYNYLKPFPENLKKQFFEKYGGEEKMSLETASPSLGSLNSGLQLYRLKYQKPADFQKIKYALHLPQYVSFLIQSRGDSKSPRDCAASDITSIGCHTMLWDFQKNDYHEWVREEGILEKLAPTKPSDAATPITNHQSTNHQIHIGVGLHDSSAALIPYLANFQEPFALLSTGTWNISLNPFNDNPLTPQELAQDCLCYLTFQGKPVKASRLFAGHEHEQTVRRIAAQFGVAEDFFQKTTFNSNDAAGRAYLEFMRQLVEKQAVSTKLILQNTPVRRIFVDGGFSKNEIFMTLLAQTFSHAEVFAAETPQATALGAALAIHRFWNKKPLPQNLISLKKIRVPSV